MRKAGWVRVRLTSAQVKGTPIKASISGQGTFPAGEIRIACRWVSREYPGHSQHPRLRRLSGVL